MNTLFIVILSVVGIFVVIFIAGMISAALRGSGKRRRAQSIVALAQIPAELRIPMRDIFVAFKKQDIGSVNAIVTSVGSVILGAMLEMMKPENRSSSLSSGKLGDTVAFSAMETELVSRGYKESAAKIITGIVMNDLDQALLDIRD